MAAPGSYILVVAVDQPTTIEVGALGDREFTAGGYAYVGSAIDPREPAGLPAATTTPATGISIIFSSGTRWRSSRFLLQARIMSVH